MAELDHCPRCGGNWFDPGEVGETFGPQAEPSSWVSSHMATSLGVSRLSCPRGHGRLEAYKVALAPKHVEVDVCPGCKGVWLDGDEGSLLGEILAAAEATKQRAHEDAGGVKTYLFQLFTGFPIEVYNPVRKRPALLLSLMVFLCAIFVVQMSAGGWFTFSLGLVPERFWDGQQLWGLFTFAFLHANLVHLLGNLYFLYIFGDNIEDALGKGPLSLIFVVTSMAGGLLESAVNPSMTIPIIGASGAISGIMGGYLVLFPRVKVWVVFLFIRFKLAAVWYLGFWALTQVLYMVLGQQGVAWFAHLGGFAAGLLVTFLLRQTSGHKART